jgi:hypothetical protein
VFIRQAICNVQAPPDPPGALLPAVSFFGGFRTPALVPVDRSALAGIRNPSHKPPPALQKGYSLTRGGEAPSLRFRLRPLAQYGGLAWDGFSTLLPPGVVGAALTMSMTLTRGRRSRSS